MATEKLYLEDSELVTFTARVTEVDGQEVVLDRTAFYPTGGGQPHDIGALSTNGTEWDVSDVHGRTTISHVVDSQPPSVDTEVSGRVDWDRRYAHMRYHTAQHLVSAVLLDEFDARTVGNQLYHDRARIDCAYDRFTATELDRLEALVNEHIDGDHEVTWSELPRERAERELDTQRTRIDLLPESIEMIRIVEIDGIDRTACAGTHVRRTGEIGRFVVEGRETAGSRKERIRFQLEDE